MIQEYKPNCHQKAIAYLQEAIDILADEQHDIKRGNCLMGMGNVYNSVENIDLALKYYEQAAGIFEDSYYLGNMASAYSNMGNCYIKLKEFETAERYHEKAL